MVLGEWPSTALTQLTSELEGVLGTTLLLESYKSAPCATINNEMAESHGK